MVMVKTWKIFNKIIVLLCLFVVFSAFEAFAIGIGSVDTRVLLMLHPNMINFDYSNGRFFRDQTPEKDYDAFYQELQKARKIAEEKNAEINKQLKESESDLFELSKALTREEQVFAPGDLKVLQQEKTNLETILKELDKKKPTNNIEISSINEQKQQIEEKIKLINDTIKSSANVVRQEKEIDRLKKQIAQVLSTMTALKDQIRKNEEEAVAAVYLTTEEANEKLESIKQEIKDIIAKTAKEANISLVIDNSFAMRTPKRKEPQSMLPITLDSIDVVSAALFHSFLNYTVDKELEATLPMPPGFEDMAGKHLLAGRSVGLADNLKQYLQFRNYLPEKFADFSGGSMFLTGTIDLTPACARKIFDKYSVEETLKQRYMQVIREFMNFETQPKEREIKY